MCGRGASNASWLFQLARRSWKEHDSMTPEVPFGCMTVSCVPRVAQWHLFV